MACLAVGAVALTGCGDGSTATGTGGGNDPVRIGVVLPLSGRNAPIGEKIQQGYEIAAQTINADDGAFGRDVNFVFVDHASSPEVGAQEAERIIQDEDVVALTGAYDSAVSLTVAQVAERRQIPFLVPYSAANAITEQGYKYTFRTRPPSKVWTAEILKFFDSLDAQIGYDVQRIAFFGEDNEISSGQQRDLSESLPSVDFAFGEPILYRAGTTDLLGLIGQAKASGANAIYGNSYLPDTLQAFRAMEALNYKVPYVTIGTTLVHPDFLQLGALAENATGTAAWGEDLGPVSQEFTRKFTERFGSDPTDDSAYAYSSAFVLMEAVATAGSTEPTEIGRTLREHDFVNEDANIIPTPDGVIRFDDTGQAEAEILFRQVQNGKFVTVYPERYAAAPLQAGQWYPAG